MVVSVVFHLFVWIISESRCRFFVWVLSKSWEFGELSVDFMSLNCMAENGKEMVCSTGQLDLRVLQAFFT